MKHKSRVRFSYLVSILPLAFTLTSCGGGKDSGDPIVDNTPVVYVQRANLVESIDDDAPVFFMQNRVEPAMFFPGAQLMLRQNTGIGAASEHLFATKLCDILDATDADFLAFCNDDRSVKPYDVKDITIDYDGQTIVFSVRPPEPDDNDLPEPTWDIWKYSFETDSLSAVMSSTALSMIGDDIAPAFLPDGDIVFSSSLQQRTRGLLLDEGKSQYQGLDEALDVPALVLHRMDIDGGSIAQLSFNMSHDLDPAILSDGRIVFSRWDNAGSVNRINLYTMNPDGSNIQILYGAHSHSRNDSNAQLEFFKPKAVENNQVLVQWTSREPAFFATNFLEIDADQYIDTSTPVYQNLGANGPAQVEPTGLTGQLTAAWPLNDGTDRVLAAWSSCRLTSTTDATVSLPCTDENNANTTLTAAPPLYGLWMFNTNAGTQTLIENGVDGRIFTESAVVASRSREPIVAAVSTTSTYNSDAAAENLGVLHIRSVYDVSGVDSSGAGIGVVSDPLQTSVADRPRRYLRLVKGVRIPPEEVRDVENAHFGVSRQQGMREILGYTPVEPDGSVKVLVPSNVPLAFDILNEDGERVTSRHQNWVTIQSGEGMECRGCHTNSNDTAVHGRLEAEPPTVNAGALADVAFPNTNPGIVASVGESMAEARARVIGLRRLTVDLVFEDDWVDPVLATAVDSVTIAHDDLETTKPLSASCIGNDGNAAWSPLCRIQIHYPTHIEPLWSLAREGLAADGVTVENWTCNSCHTRRDELNELVVPAGQLELSSDNSPDQALQSISYRELLANDNRVELRDGALQEELVQVLQNGEPVPVLDIDGEPVLDINGDPIFETTTVAVGRTMSQAGARSSQDFFTVFSTDTGTVDHQGYLSDAELLLIREWLDIGAQYYNDPFATPN